MSEVRYSHVALNCDDPDVVERYYTQHFGFRRARTIPIGDGQIVFIRCGDVYLELFKAESGPKAPRANGDGPHTRGVRHLAFQVDDVDAKLATMGGAATITLGPLGFDAFIPRWRTVWLADPEGNVVEVSQGYKDEE